MSVEQSSQETTPWDAIGHTCSWNSFLEIECPLTSIVLTAKSRLLWSWKTLKKTELLSGHFWSMLQCNIWLHREGAEDGHSVSKPIRFALALNVGDGVYWSHKSVKRKALFFFPHSFLATGCCNYRRRLLLAIRENAAYGQDCFTAKICS